MGGQEKPEFLVGQQLGSYQIVSLLGAGGMGEVYRARDTRLGVLPSSIVAKLPEASSGQRNGSGEPIQ
jgi:serine/threonine protein kinase